MRAVLDMLRATGDNEKCANNRNNWDDSFYLRHKNTSCQSLDPSLAYKSSKRCALRRSSALSDQAIRDLGDERNREECLRLTIEDKKRYLIREFRIDHQDAPARFNPNRTRAQTRAMETRHNLINVIRLEPEPNHTLARLRDRRITRHDPDY